MQLNNYIYNLFILGMTSTEINKKIKKKMKMISKNMIL